MIISRQGFLRVAKRFFCFPLFRTEKHPSEKRRAGPPPAWSISPWDGLPAVAWKTPQGCNGRDRAWFQSNSPVELETETSPNEDTLWSSHDTNWLSKHQTFVRWSKFRGSEGHGQFFFGPKLIYLQVYSLRDEITSAKPRVLSSQLVELVLGGSFHHAFLQKVSPS